MVDCCVHVKGHGPGVRATRLARVPTSLDSSRPILKTCGAYGNCPLSKWRFVASRAAEPLHEETMDRLSDLPGHYARVAQCLTGSQTCPATDWSRPGKSLGVDPSKALLTEYPDLSTRMDGSGMDSPDGFTYCTNALKGLSVGGGYEAGIANREFAWAREVVQRGRAGTTFTYSKDRKRGRDVPVKLAVTANGLNQVINGSPSGLTPVTGTFRAFRGHGYCADKSWITPMKLSYVKTANETDPFHPNKLGYKKWGAIIGNALEAHLSS